MPVANFLNAAAASGVPSKPPLTRLKIDERAVGGDRAAPWPTAVLELVEALEHLGRERIVGLDQHQHVLAVAEDLLEALVGDVVGIGLHDQAIERVVLLRP